MFSVYTIPQRNVVLLQMILCRGKLSGVAIHKMFKSAVLFTLSTWENPSTSVGKYTAYVWWIWLQKTASARPRRKLPLDKDTGISLHLFTAVMSRVTCNSHVTCKSRATHVKGLVGYRPFFLVWQFGEVQRTGAFHFLFKMQRIFTPDIPKLTRLKKKNTNQH